MGHRTREPLPPPPAMEFHRQLDFFNPQVEGNVQLTLIGCGGIGSPTALCLTKMGFPRLQLWDGDTVEPHNLPNQIFPVNSLGQPKAIVLAQECERYSGILPDARPEMFERGDGLEGVVISGVDSMEARKMIWRELRYRPSVQVYIEARMGGQVGIIHTLDPTDPEQIARYERTLYTDEEAQDEPCTARAIMYNVFAIASLISNQVKRHVKGETTQPRMMIDLENGLLLN